MKLFGGQLAAEKTYDLCMSFACLRQKGGGNGRDREGTGGNGREREGIEAPPEQAQTAPPNNVKGSFVLNIKNCNISIRNVK